MKGAFPYHDHALRKSHKPPPSCSHRVALQLKHNPMRSLKTLPLAVRYFSDIGSNFQAEQTNKVVIAHEKVLIDQQPNWIVVVGDLKWIMAVTNAVRKERIRVAHLEDG